MSHAALRLILCTIVLTLAWAGPASAGNWPQWRGPLGTSVSDETGLPVKWSENDSVLWKCPLPGDGPSTPAIWDNAVFVTSADEDKLLLLKIDKATGQVEWTRQVGTGTPRRGEMRKGGRASRGQQNVHPLNNLASPSPVT